VAPVPIRTCIGCRGRAAETDLVRLVVVGARVRPGPRKNQPGRGASIHPRDACVTAALKSHAFARAFRMQIDFPKSGPHVTDADMMRARVGDLVRDIQASYASQQPGAGRTT
jgi:predicted RNA-binding protein YlxR (DUF448 family)